MNSLIVALATTLISLPLATALAYVFARYNLGGATLRLGVLASQMLPPIILVLPLFVVFLSAGLMQSRLGLIIAHLTICLPFLAWMLVSFFEGDVARLEEAARVDGATRWQAFIKIAVPVAAPGLLAAGLLGFILSWNEFLFALVLSGPDTQTLPVGLAGLETHAGVEIAPLAAATVVSLLPVFRKCRTATWLLRNTPRALTSKLKSHSSSVKSTTRFMVETPALAQSRS
jgi:multiple sugar transport system permease protein